MLTIKATEPQSFKITYTITDCSDCPSRKHDPNYGNVCLHWDDDPIGGKRLYDQNCNGLTESCPVIDWMKGAP